MTMDIHERLTDIIREFCSEGKTENYADAAYEILNEFALLNKGEILDILSGVRTLEDVILARALMRSNNRVNP